LIFNDAGQKRSEFARRVGCPGNDAIAGHGLDADDASDRDGNLVFVFGLQDQVAV
jgi:hypothetical protein